MGKFIVHSDDLYFEWSTIVDAPVSAAMTKAEFEAYYEHRYGEDAMRDLPSRMDRAIAQGCSCLNPVMTAEACVAGNRAAANEAEASFEEVMRQVIEGRPEFGLPPLAQKPA